MTPEYLVESEARVVDLTDAQANALRSLGKQLRSPLGYWGSDEAELDDEDQRSVLTCDQVDGHAHRVLIRNAVGLVAVGGLQFEVGPKIPLPHFVALLKHAGAIPRTASTRAAAAPDTTLWELICQWFIDAIYALLRRGLLSDYSEHRGLLNAARGRVLALETARAYYVGRIGVECEYDEFDGDTALNRILRAALTTIASSPAASFGVRRKAMQQTARFDIVGDLRQGDLPGDIDRRSAYYSDAIALARHILSSKARTITSGKDVAWSFLIQTPGTVEAAVREVLTQGLADVVPVRKRGRQLAPSKKTLNPDLVFGTRAVGDVKYKVIGKDWGRPDLYQAVSFATGYRVGIATIVSFGTGGNRPSSLRVGDVSVTPLVWDCSLSPDQAAPDLVAQARRWLGYSLRV